VLKVTMAPMLRERSHASHSNNNMLNEAAPGQLA